MHLKICKKTNVLSKKRDKHMFEIDLIIMKGGNNYNSSNNYSVKGRIHIHHYNDSHNSNP